MPIDVIQKEANPMNHFTSLDQNSQIRQYNLGAGKNDSDLITMEIRFPS